LALSLEGIRKITKDLSAQLEAAPVWTRYFINERCINAVLNHSSICYEIPDHHSIKKRIKHIPVKICEEASLRLLDEIFYP
jgi:hypothetical protein